MDEGVREAARAVRPFLGEFLEPGAARELDAQLASLLKDAPDGQGTDEKLKAALRTHEATQVFLERVLGDAPLFRPPSVLSEVTRAYSGLPGDKSPVPAEKYACPHGDYVTYWLEVGADIELCPTHHCPLERR